MKQWKINEKIAHEWVKKNLDSKAILHGGSDSSAPDITLSNGDIYEVKSVESHCGQFTAKTAHKYKYSDDVQEYFLGIYGRDLEPNETFYLNNHSICKTWVKAYYKNIKKVKAFLVVEDGKVIEQSLEDYFDNHIFKCTYRFKKSGSESDIPKWAVKLLPEHWKCINDGKKYYASNPNVFKEKIYGFDTRGNQKVISVEENNQIKILSGTCTPTFIFDVKEKK
jgi:hypothetical protein